MKVRLIVSIIFLVPLMYIAMYHMLNEWFSIPIPNFIIALFHGPENALRFSITQVLLVIPIVIANIKYFVSGFKNLLKRTPNMDSLIAIGATASIAYGGFAIIQIASGLSASNMEIVTQYSMDLYFESAGTILTLITVGKYLETKAKRKTSEAITKLINLTPKTAIILAENEEKEVLVKDLKKGDIVVIKPGQIIPIDGEIIEGNTSVDESAITGESIPVEKKVADIVIGATINQLGNIRIKVTKIGEDTTLSQIIHLVEQASSSKAPIAKLADKISGVFVPIVIIISIIAMIIWLLLGQSVDFALSIAIAILVISCPCALGLATPVAIMVGTGKGAENGILYKSAESIETTHKVNTIVLDKTGTITNGKPEVTNTIVMESALTENKLLQIIASIEKASEHPLAEAILQKAREMELELVKITNFEAIVGYGVKAEIEQKAYFIGNKKLMNKQKIQMTDSEQIVEELTKQGKSVLYCANQTNLLGIVCVADKIKQGSKQAIQKFNKMGMQVIMLTGDNQNTANAIKQELGIHQVIAELLPQNKEEEIRKLQEQGKVVAMVGDGINDSPALARANVGIAIGAGTDIAIETADIVLMKSDLQDVATAIQLSKATMKNIKENLFWAFIYNIIGIPVAAGLFYLSFGLKLNPMLAAGAMSLSSVCVVLNALRLRLWK